GEQPAVLHPPLIGLALDVQDDPAGLRVAVAGAVALNRARVGSALRRARGREQGQECEQRQARQACPGAYLGGVGREARERDGALSGPPPAGGNSKGGGLLAWCRWAGLLQ